MVLTKHGCDDGTERWAADGRWLSTGFDFKRMCGMSRPQAEAYVDSHRTEEKAGGPLLAPIEPDQEVWACGVTYSRSRDAREAETEIKNVYDRVYVAERPELFFKAIGWRVRGPGAEIRIRADSRWNVPEPELTLLIGGDGGILGYCAGNDVSSRSIEGENPLYLPQAKVYDGSCALGPGIRLADAAQMTDLPIRLTIERGGRAVFEGDTRTSQIRRPLPELASYLTREMDFPHGAFLMTGTGVVPEEDFSLAAGDEVTVGVGALSLENHVA